MRNCLLSFGLILSLLVLGPASAISAEVRQVSTPEELAQVLTLSSGETLIELAPGDYGMLSMTGGAENAAVTLRSQDPTRPARFSSMLLRDVRGLTIENVEFDYTFAPDDKIFLRPFQVVNCQDITIRGVLFDGDVARGRSLIDDGFPAAIGFSLRDSKDVTLESSEIRGFFRGLAIRSSSDVVIRGNDMHSIRMDGMNFAQVQSVRIEDNHIHDFLRNLNSKDHSDMIQFWTSKTEAPSQDIVIRNNVLNSGDGLFTQSIFMRNEMVDTGKAGPEMFYQRIMIEENVIFNAHAHGITVGETNGLTVRHNSLIRNAKSSGPRPSVTLYQPRINIASASRDVTVEANVASSINGQGGQPDWRVVGNIFVQDQSITKPGYYAAVFAPAVGDLPAALHAFYTKAGGAIDKAGAGAARLRP